jgi:hypothetical protein
MTQAELEQVAGDMRARGLHSSWDSLMEFSRGVVGNLIDAYKALAGNPLSKDGRSSVSNDELIYVVKDRLAKALALLTSKEQVARWGEEALEG